MFTSFAYLQQNLNKKQEENIGLNYMMFSFGTLMEWFLELLFILWFEGRIAFPFQYYFHFFIYFYSTSLFMLIPWLLVHGLTFGNHARDLIFQFWLNFLAFFRVSCPICKFSKFGWIFKYCFEGNIFQIWIFNFFVVFGFCFCGCFQCIHFGNI